MGATDRQRVPAYHLPRGLPVTVMLPLAGPESPLAWVVAVLCVTSAAPLLGWVYGLAPFHLLFLTTALPATVAVISVCGWLTARHPESQLLRAARVGALAGVVATVGSDLLRTPLVAGDVRLLTPIETTGVLLAGADGSSGLTTVLGWTYHLANGVLFATAYAVIAYRRSWGWGLAWGFLLATATMVTPFADIYGLSGNARIVALVWAAWGVYGAAVGVMVAPAERAERWLAGRSAPVTGVLGATAVVLALWLQPWVVSLRPPPGADVMVADGAMQPRFVRHPSSSCAVAVNLDAVVYQLHAGARRWRLPSTGRVGLCVPPGVHSVRATNRALTGGFVISDPTIADAP